METKSFVFAIFFVTLISVISPIKIPTLKHCCELGKAHANIGSQCDSYKTPIASVDKADEALCINSITVCCKNQLKEKQCSLGQTDSKSGQCTKDSKERTDCCEACLIGMQTGKTGQSCENILGLGQPYDTAFQTCCNEAKVTTSTTISTRSRSIPTFGDDPLPGIENLCDIGDLCAQICIPGGDSYICKCHPGYSLMADGISCKESKTSTPASSRRSNRCEKNNPCEHNCTDTGVAIQCSCEDGYQLAKDKRSCRDIDECALNIHTCIENLEVCINGIGYYDCELLESEEDSSEYGKMCPEGYKFNGDKQTCDDIDECQIVLICQSYQKCTNTIGSYRCDDNAIQQCPPGFYFKDATQYCEDVDECATGNNDCNRESQVCLNTKGNFTCMDKASKKTCPAGFKMNLETTTCEDINECIEYEDLCEAGTECVNEPGGHTCITSSAAVPYKPPQREITQKTAPTTQSTTPYRTKQTTTQTFPPISATRPTIATRPTTTIATTVTTKATTTTKQTTPTTITTKRTEPTTQRAPQTFSIQYNTRPTYYYFSTKPTTTHKPAYPPYQKPNGPTICHKGFAYSHEQKQCIDIDECSEDVNACDQHQDCYNTHGSFVCNCKRGFTKDRATSACIDINECQTKSDDCSEGHRCDNTIGSFICARVAGCGTGYTLNYDNGLCEDDDECKLGTHHCSHIGSQLQCINTKGSYRCIRVSKPAIPRTNVYPSTNYSINVPLRPKGVQVKRCLPGYYMNPFGHCQDINECESNPCSRGQNCINLNGKFECVSNIECKSGYELNEAADSCIDINECTRGTHTCSATQLCRNGIGYHMCYCQPGHKRVQNECVDINECELFKGHICSINSDCINNMGSYKCRCKDGFREEGNSCVDIDECGESQGLCSDICVNVWGSYRCSCKRGFTLNADNRTCSDVNECEEYKDRTLCIGTCENIPGSYVCQCPPGYKIGSDGRTCQDIDECVTQAPCTGRDEICYNTRGSYACPSISCPPDYVRDGDHKRCKRHRGAVHALGPEQYSYHFVSFVSRLPLVQGKAIDFFQMKGPSWAGSTEKFGLKLENVNCPSHVEKVNINYFRLTRDAHRAMVSVVRPIEGPQQIELSLEMQLYSQDSFSGTVVAKLFIFVTEYTF